MRPLPVAQSPLGQRPGGKETSCASLYSTKPCRRQVHAAHSGQRRYIKPEKAGRSDNGPPTGLHVEQASWRLELRCGRQSGVKQWNKCQPLLRRAESGQAAAGDGHRWQLGAGPIETGTASIEHSGFVTVVTEIRHLHCAGLTNRHLPVHTSPAQRLQRETEE